MNEIEVNATCCPSCNGELAFQCSEGDTGKVQRYYVCLSCGKWYFVVEWVKSYERQSR